MICWHAQALEVHNCVITVILYSAAAVLYVRWLLISVLDAWFRALTKFVGRALQCNNFLRSWHIFTYHSCLN